MTEWQEIGGVEPGRLAAARVQVHWAAQAAAAPGKVLVPHRPDFAEQSFVWRGAAGALVQGRFAVPAPGGRGPSAHLRSALRLASPAVMLLGEGDDEVVAELPLAGRTLEEIYGWYEGEIGARIGCLLPPLERAAAVPAHAFGAGARFDGEDGEAFGELARLFANADGVLRGWLLGEASAAAVRCWPHHFDLAATMPLAGGGAAAGEAARTIGIGMVPGDVARPRPYFYVSLWPSPPPARLAALPELPAGGTWNSAGWFGAVLAAPRFMGAGGAAAQAARVTEFLTGAVAACRGLSEALE